MDDQNDNASRARAGAGDGAHAGERVPNQDSSKFQALRAAILDRDLSIGDCRLYAELLAQPTFERNGVLTCRPSRVRLAKGSGVHLQSIRRSTANLIQSGYIQVAYGAGRSTNRFTLLRVPTGSAPAPGSASAPGNKVAASEGTNALPLSDRRGSACATTTGGTGSAPAPQLLRHPQSVPLARAAFDPDVDSGHHEEEQGPDTTLQASASRRNDPSPASPGAELWGDGLKYLMAVCNLKQSTARGFLGRFVNAAGSSECALQLIAEAKRLQVADPQAWLMKAAKNVSTKGKARHVEMTEAEQLAYLTAQAKRFSND